MVEVGLRGVAIGAEWVDGHSMRNSAGKSGNTRPTTWGVRLDMSVSELAMSTVGVGKITSGESDGLVKKLSPEYKALHLQVAFHVVTNTLQDLLYA